MSLPPTYPLLDRAVAFVVYRPGELVPWNDWERAGAAPLDRLRQVVDHLLASRGIQAPLGLASQQLAAAAGLHQADPATRSEILHIVAELGAPPESTKPRQHRPDDWVRVLAPLRFLDGAEVPAGVRLEVLRDDDELLGPGWRSWKRGRKAVAVQFQGVARFLEMGRDCMREQL